MANRHGTADSDSDDSNHSSASAETIDDDEENTELITNSQVVDIEDVVNNTEDDELGSENGINHNLPSMTELRKKFSELIETCQDYKDNDEIEEDLQEAMTRSIMTGQKLFNKLEGGPGEMYVACLHAKVCSGIILSKTEKIGTSVCGFQLETFLSSLYEKSQGGEDEEYSPENAATMIALEANRAQKTLPTLVSLLGAFDRSVILTPPETVKKVRAPPRRKIFDDSEDTATQHEQVLVTEEQRAIKDKESPEARSKELLKVLQRLHRINNKVPRNMLEFVLLSQVGSGPEEINAMEKYFTKLFYIAFLARDGFVSIQRKKRKNGKRKFDSDLFVAPEEPPQKDQNNIHDDSIPRSQHIISFNSKIFKAIADHTN